MAKIKEFLLPYLSTSIKLTSSSHFWSSSKYFSHVSLLSVFGRLLELSYRRTESPPWGEARGARLHPNTSSPHAAILPFAKLGNKLSVKTARENQN